MINCARMCDIAAKYDVLLGDNQLSQLNTYAKLLVSWNEVMNLTAITQAEEIEEKHFLDCLLAARFINDGASVIDVGTGAGFPGMVLKIAQPSIRLTLLDSLDKRLGFLREVCDEIGADAEFLHLRAEEAGRLPEHREQYDIATARAVAPLNVLAEFCLPLVKVGGTFIAMKGKSAQEELSAAADAIALLGGRHEKTVCFTLPDGSERNIIIVRKVATSPEKYPRRSPAIKKKPL
ncbi:MAG: 16S rRNA (guanine(527)-N(7))-methyltransferase RsmG [Clostridia bacterium]|nr:16S rRNA (guanine(527)-N(7))-methyltransferase RsmG [Clostridia bacterium]